MKAIVPGNSEGAGSAAVGAELSKENLAVDATLNLDGSAGEWVAEMYKKSPVVESFSSSAHLPTAAVASLEMKDVAGSLSVASLDA
jgi:hypothetical protein